MAVVDSTTSTFPTPYVYYTGFQMQQAQVVTVSGFAQCITSTTSVPFPTPVWAAYSGNPHSDWAGKDQVSGPLPTNPPLTAMASSLGHTGFDAGTFAGTPTLSVVIHAVTDASATSVNGPTVPGGGGKNILQSSRLWFVLRLQQQGRQHQGRAY